MRTDTGYIPVRLRCGGHSGQAGMAGKKAAKFSVEQSPNYYIYSIQARSYANLSGVLRPYDLNPPAWRVLANLQERDGISVRDLARRTAIDVSNLSKLVNAMARSGLVQKGPSAQDARVSLTFLTDAGRAKFAAALPAVEQVLDHSLAGFSAAERSRFLDYLARMLKNVNA